MLKQVAAFANLINIDSNIDVEQDGNRVLISIRDAKGDEPTEQALADAREVIRVIRKEFENAIKIESETDEEWVNITIRER